VLGWKSKIQNSKKCVRRKFWITKIIEDIKFVNYKNYEANKICKVLTIKFDVHDWSGVFSHGLSGSFVFVFQPKSVAPFQQLHSVLVLLSSQLSQHGVLDEEVNRWMQVMKRWIGGRKWCFPKIMSTNCVLKIAIFLKWPDHHETKNGIVFSIDSVVAWLPRMLKSLNNANVFSVESCVVLLRRIWTPQEALLFQAINLSYSDGSIFSTTDLQCLFCWLGSRKWLRKILKSLNNWNVFFIVLIVAWQPRIWMPSEVLSLTRTAATFPSLRLKRFIVAFNQIISMLENRASCRQRTCRIYANGRKHSIVV
jgi:hypothetical protein